MGSHLPAIAAAIDSMQGTLRVAAALLEGGRSIDLEGLDVEAARLCLAVGVLPRDQAEPLRPALEALLRDLDQVTAALPRPDGIAPD